MDKREKTERDLVIERLWRTEGMKRKHEEKEHELRMYAVKQHEIRKQLIPPIFFFVGVGAIILISVVKHHQKVEAGGTELSSDAIIVDYMSAAVGLEIFENTDELDDSYGDYFYLGADFYEAGVGTTMEVMGHVGTTVFDGEDMVDNFTWTCDDSDVTQDEVDALAEELVAAYGEYQEDENGVYRWYASEDGTLGGNDKLAWISCGLDENGIFVIEGEAQ